MWVRAGAENLFEFDLNQNFGETTQKCRGRNPIVLVPGVGGSRLNGIGTVDRKVRMPVYCSRELAEWTKLWMVWGDAIPGRNECFFKYLTLEYKPQTGMMGDISNLTIIPPEFGKVYSVETLSDDKFIHYASRYYYNMIKFFEGYGWTSDVDLLGAPFDWRKMDTDVFFRNLSALIIDTAQATGKKIELVSHSMGSLYIHLFWKSEHGKKALPHVHKWHAISSPWTGAVQMLKAVLSGDNFHMPMKPSTLVPLIRTLDGAYSLVPNPQYSLYKSQPVAEVAGVQYTASQYDELMKLANISRGMQFIDTAFKLIGPIDKPSVPVRCYYTHETPTMSLLRYNSSAFEEPAVEYGDGDGTVNIESLKYACDKWGAPTLVDKGDHLGALSSASFLDAILQDSCTEFDL